MFEHQKIVKFELSCRRELNLANICWHICFTFFSRAKHVKNMQKIEPRNNVLMIVSTMIFGVKIGLQPDFSKSSLNAKVTAW